MITESSMIFDLAVWMKRAEELGFTVTECNCAPGLCASVDKNCKLYIALKGGEKVGYYKMVYNFGIFF